MTQHDLRFPPDRDIKGVRGQSVNIAMCQSVVQEIKYLYLNWLYLGIELHIFKDSGKGEIWSFR